MSSRSIRIINEKGLHARAAALGRARPPAPPQLGHLFEPPLDPFLAAALPIKLP